MAEVDEQVLIDIQQRVLWLSTRIIDAANHDRDTGDRVKVGGHQASSASMVSALTALYFAHLDGPDRVSVKPHASPAFHAIQYLLGHLDRSYLTRPSARGGLQSYPSRTQGPGRGRLRDRLRRPGRRGPPVRGGGPPLRRRPLRGAAAQPLHRPAR